MTETTSPWNRECVICAHKWQGDDADNCPACIERVEAMWERNGVGSKSSTVRRPKVSRVEVLDQNGRQYVTWGLDGVILSYQDEGRTLRVVLEDRKELQNART